MEKKNVGRPKKDHKDKLVTLNLRISSTDRELLRKLTDKQGNISDTDTLRRLIRKEAAKEKIE